MYALIVKKLDTFLLDVLTEEKMIEVMIDILRRNLIEVITNIIEVTINQKERIPETTRIKARRLAT